MQADPDALAAKILAMPAGGEESEPSSGEVDVEAEAVTAASSDLLDALERKDVSGVSAALRAAFRAMGG